jgi:hypothetical protein
VRILFDGLIVVGSLLAVVSVIWIVSAGVTWIYDRGEIADAPLFDGGKLASPAAVKKEYERRVATQHRLYLRLRRGVPWSIGALVLAIVLIALGIH